jgi:hypothetical protein
LQLQEYKQSKGGVIPAGVGTTVHSINETGGGGSSQSNGGTNNNGVTSSGTVHTNGGNEQPCSISILQSMLPPPPIGRPVEHLPPPPPPPTLVTSAAESPAHVVEGEVELLLRTDFVQQPDLLPSISSSLTSFTPEYINQSSVQTSEPLEVPAAVNTYFNPSIYTPSAPLESVENVSSAEVTVVGMGDVHHPVVDGPPPPQTTSFVATSMPPTSGFIPTTTSASNVSSPPMASEIFKQNRNTDAGQDFPVNFFQPAPVAQEYQPVSFSNSVFQQQPSSSGPQDFIFSQPQTPLFYNVQGSNVTAMHAQQPPQQQNFTGEQMEQGGGGHISPAAETTSVHTAIEAHGQQALSPIAGNNPVDNYSNEQVSPVHGSINQNTVESESGNIEAELAFTIQSTDSRDLHQTSKTKLSDDGRPSPELHRTGSRQPILREFSTRTPTPSQRRLSSSSQDDKDRQEFQAMVRMQSVHDALELQLEELRRDNRRLSDVKSEVSSQLEKCEKTIQELRRERDRAKEDAKKLLQPYQTRINSLIEENQQILKNSNDVGMELRMKLQEKSEQHEKMVHACMLVVSLPHYHAKAKL